MAKAKVELVCKNCGETFTRTKMCQRSSDARSWEDWAIENIDTCPECYEQAQKEDADKARQEKLDSVSNLDLPPLEGSAKQISWAETIRADFVQDGVTNHPKAKDKILEFCAQKTSASWWIDHRNNDMAVRAYSQWNNENTGKCTARPYALPELSGTEKQVAWANKIRDNLVDMVVLVKDDEVFQRMIEGISTKTDAQWWINKRNYIDDTSISYTILLFGEFLKVMDANGKLIRAAKSVKHKRTSNLRESVNAGRSYSMKIVKCMKTLEDKRDADCPYQYILKHGLGSGSLPKDVNIGRIEDLDNYRTIIYVDRPLSKKELMDYDIYPETMNREILDGIKSSHNCRRKPVKASKMYSVSFTRFDGPCQSNLVISDDEDSIYDYFNADGCHLIGICVSHESLDSVRRKGKPIIDLTAKKSGVESSKSFSVKSSKDSYTPPYAIWVLDGNTETWKYWSTSSTESIDVERFLKKLNHQVFPKDTYDNNYVDVLILPNDGSEPNDGRAVMSGSAVCANCEFDTPLSIYFNHEHIYDGMPYDLGFRDAIERICNSSEEARSGLTKLIRSYGISDIDENDPKDIAITIEWLVDGDMVDCNDCEDFYFDGNECCDLEIFPSDTIVTA